MTNEERINIAKLAVFEALSQEFSNSHAVLTFNTAEVVGSTYISDRTDSDVDILCWDKSFDINNMTFSGWAYGGSGGLCPYDGKWMSWKREVNGVTVNMLLTRDADYYGKWLTAAEVCRFIHLKAGQLDHEALCDGLTRAMVHGVHEIIMDDSTAEDEIKRRNY